MNANVIVRLSETGRKADILAGGTGETPKTLTVRPEDPEFREVVAAGSFERDVPTLNLSYHYDQHRLWDHIPSVREVLDYLAEKTTREVEEKAAKAAQVRAATLAVLTERRTSPRHDYVRWNEERGLSDRCDTLIGPDWPYSADQEVVNSPEAQAWLVEIKDENDRRKVEFIAAKQAELAAREAKEAEAEAKKAARRAKLGLEDGDEAFSFEDNALVSVPIWSDHKRSKTWMAKIEVNPKSPGGLDRNFAEKAKGDSYYIVPSLNPGDPIEFGADYYSGSGRKSADRWYGYVVRVDPETETTRGLLVLHKCETGKQAVSLGKKFAATVEAKVT